MHVDEIYFYLFNENFVIDKRHSFITPLIVWNFFFQINQLHIGA